MVSLELRASRKFLIILVLVVFSPYILIWCTYGISYAVVEKKLRNHYGEFIKVYSCDTNINSRNENLNEISLNHDPVYSWMKPFFLYKGFKYYLNYNVKDGEPPNSIGAATGTVTAWGTIKADPDGFYGCGL